MQRMMSEKLVLVLPGVVLAVGLVLGLLQLGGQDSYQDKPTFTQFVAAAGHAGLESGEVPALPRRQGNMRPEAAGGEEFAATNGLADVDELRATLPSEVSYDLTIVGSDGLPVPNARLEIVEKSPLHINNAQQNTAVLGALSRREVTTDQNGSYSFTESVDSRFEVQVKVDGYAPKRYRLRKPGAKLIQLVKNARILGTVWGPGDEPVAGVEVQLWDSSSRSNRIAVTNEDGFYRFESVTPSCATLRINDPRFHREVEHRIRMEGRTDYQQDFFLSRGAPLTVKVLGLRGQPAAGAWVTLVELDSGLTCGRLQADNDGEVFFSCLEEKSTYLVQASEGGAICRSLVPRGPEGSVDHVQIQLRLAVPLRGIARAANSDGAGVPIAGAMVILESELTADTLSRHQVVVTTDEEGRFTAEGLDPALNYTAFLYHQAYALGVTEGIVPAVAPEPEAVDVEPESQEVREFVLHPPSRFDGVALGRDGKPVTRASITLMNTALSPAAIGATLSVRPDQTGRYSFTNLAPGTYSLSITDLRTGDTLDGIRVDVDSGQVHAPGFVQGALDKPLIVDLSSQ